MSCSLYVIGDVDMLRATVYISSDQFGDAPLNRKGLPSLKIIGQIWMSLHKNGSLNATASMAELDQLFCEEGTDPGMTSSSPSVDYRLMLKIANGFSFLLREDLLNAWQRSVTGFMTLMDTKLGTSLIARSPAKIIRYLQAT